MEFRVLGSLEVVDQGTVVDLGPPRLRVLCGVLLARSGELVPLDQFVDELWPDRPPPDARALVRGYVSRLRRALRSGPSGESRVVTRKPGYLLRVEEQELDLHRFERLIGLARAARQATRLRHSFELFRQAHDLWRGDSLADVPRTATIATTATWMTEQRLTTLEEWFQVALAAGRDADVVTELTEFVTAHPLRERPAGQLMLALYRSGRRVEALEQYKRIRRSLAEEVGVDPCGDLRQLHQRILDCDPDLTAETPGTATRVTPRQLPRDLTTFVGRDRELTELLAHLDNGPGPVAVVHGAPGVGKSALAVRAGHLSTTRFPDGQLHVNLCGATTGLAPISPAAAVHQALRALGVTRTGIPADIDEAAALFRTLVADRRLLILLDNAVTPAQVRPLLPGSPGSAVLVTSRTRLAALENAAHLLLGPLHPDAAYRMLDGLVSDARTTAEPDDTRRLAELCDHLPLGLHVAAARLNARTRWAVGDLVGRLADERHRLTELTAGDVALRGSLTVSYTALSGSDDPTDQAAARALCMLGLLPVTGVDLDLAAAVLDVSRVAADRVIERLLDAHLVAETVPGQFHMHDLTRLFAGELGTETLPPDERSAAFTRMLSHYLATARHANTLAHPQRAHLQVAGTDTRPLADRQEALRWLDEHRRDLVVIARQALTGPADHIRLGVGLILALHLHLCAGADERADDRHAQACVLGSLVASLS